jgi:hypothetical protein
MKIQPQIEVALIPPLAPCREPRNLGRLRYIFRGAFMSHRDALKR